MRSSPASSRGIPRKLAGTTEPYKNLLGPSLAVQVAQQWAASQGPSPSLQGVGASVRGQNLRELEEGHLLRVRLPSPQRLPPWTLTSQVLGGQTAVLAIGLLSVGVQSSSLAADNQGAGAGCSPSDWQNPRAPPQACI